MSKKELHCPIINFDFKEEVLNKYVSALHGLLDF
jgi:hypothetical protein